MHAGTAPHPDTVRPLFRSPHALKLGLFGANLAGIGLTAIPERWMARWDDNVTVAKMADEAGLDFLLPVARWKGYGGSTDPQGTSFETLTWATGLLAITTKITVFATVHIPMIHPVLAAKQCVTADHVGHGRFGLNIVCGWNEDEFQMFGVQRMGEDRYEFAREWIGIVKSVWTRSDTFDIDGRYFQLKGVRAQPKPWGAGLPPLVNARQSDEGVAFAVNQCDILFSSPPGRDPAKLGASVDAIRERAGKRFPVFTACVIICRKTRQEAQEFQRYCDENGDPEAIDNVLSAKRRSGRNVVVGDEQKARHEASRNMAVYIVGDPDDVARQLKQLHDGGADGVAMMFTNQLDELPLFVAEVLPRLRALGLRSE